MSNRYYLTLSDPARARGEHPAFAFRSQGAEGLAAELQEALRSDALFQRWREAQEDPDAVDPTLGETDPDATVSGRQHDLKIDLVATTSVPGSVLKQRMRLLAGNGWTLADVTAA